MRCRAFLGRGRARVEPKASSTSCSHHTCAMYLPMPKATPTPSASNRLLGLGAFLDAAEVPMPFVGIGPWCLDVFHTRFLVTILPLSLSSLMYR